MRTAHAAENSGRDLPYLKIQLESKIIQTRHPKLDFARAKREKQSEVTFARPNFYAEWRERSGLGPLLREHDSVPPERLLQVVWFHQRLLRDKLVGLDGNALQVLHPGFWNHEGGPDFRQAVVQWPGEQPRLGDIEVDLHSSGWHCHGHDRH